MIELLKGLPLQMEADGPGHVTVCTVGKSIRTTCDTGTVDDDN